MTLVLTNLFFAATTFRSAGTHHTLHRRRSYQALTPSKKKKPALHGSRLQQHHDPLWRAPTNLRASPPKPSSSSSSAYLSSSPSVSCLDNAAYARGRIYRGDPCMGPATGIIYPDFLASYSLSGSRGLCPGSPASAERQLRAQVRVRVRVGIDGAGQRPLRARLLRLRAGSTTGDRSGRGISGPKILRSPCWRRRSRSFFGQEECRIRFLGLLLARLRGSIFSGGD